MRNHFFYMGLGGGANLSLHPPFRHKGDAPDPLAMGLMGGGSPPSQTGEGGWEGLEWGGG